VAKFNFDDLDPAAKRAAFAHMGGGKRHLGSGSRHKKLSAKKKAAVEHHGKATVSGKLGHGSMKGELSPADHEKGAMGGKLPIAKARPVAPKPAAKPAADTPEARFDSHVTSKIRELTKRTGNISAGLADMRPSLDSMGMSRAEQDKHLKRMSREGKIHIIPEDNRKALKQIDHDTAIHIGGEPNHLVSLAEDRNHPNAAPRTSSPTPLQSAGSKKPAAKPAQKDLASLAKDFVDQHGAESVAPRIAFLEKKKRLLPGERAQLAALKSLGKK